MPGTNPGTTGLISWWSLDEASGQRNDSHGSNHLTDNNTVLSAAGKVGNAADFEKSNSEFLSIADNPNLSTGDIDFTIAIWVKPETASFPILGKITNPSPLEYSISRVGGTGAFQFLVSSNGTAWTGTVSS